MIFQLLAWTQPSGVLRENGRRERRDQHGSPARRPPRPSRGSGSPTLRQRWIEIQESWFPHHSTRNCNAKRERSSGSAALAKLESPEDGRAGVPPVLPGPATTRGRRTGVTLP